MARQNLTLPVALHLFATSGVDARKAVNGPHSASLKVITPAETGAIEALFAHQISRMAESKGLSNAEAAKAFLAQHAQQVETLGLNAERITNIASNKVLLTSNLTHHGLNTIDTKAVFEATSFEELRNLYDFAVYHGGNVGAQDVSRIETALAKQIRTHVQNSGQTTAEASKELLGRHSHDIRRLTLDTDRITNIASDRALTESNEKHWFGDIIKDAEQVAKEVEKVAEKSGNTKKWIIGGVVAAAVLGIAAFSRKKTDIAANKTQEKDTGEAGAVAGVIAGVGR